MKYILPLFWALCLLYSSCKSIPAAAPEAESGGSLEAPAAPPDGGGEEPSGLEAAVEPEAGGDLAEDLPAAEETPDITPVDPVPSDFSPDASGEFAALPEPVFPEPEAASETVIAPFPEAAPSSSDPLVRNLVLDEPPVLDVIIPEPAPALVQSAPPAGEPAPQAPPASPPAPAPTPPPKPAPPPAPSGPPPARPRPAEQPSGQRREPLPLPPSSIPDLPAREPPAPPAIPPPDGEIEYSRIVRAAVGQIIEIPFRGTGWVYLGELRSRPGVAYNSRRSESEGQTFIFRAEGEGTFGLKFYKQDYIRDYILNDHVQVIVSEASGGEASALAGDRGRTITAPRWPYLPGEEPSGESAAAPAEDSRTGDALSVSAAPFGEAAAPQAPAVQPLAPPPPAAAGRRPPARTEGWDDGSIAPAAQPTAAGGQTGPEAAAASPEDVRPDEYFRRARDAFEAGQVQPALAILDEFRRRYPLGSDEAWWLYGQFLEAAGPSRNIRSALDYYRRLVREYPQSPRCNDARGRIAYLERFYFNIR